MYPSKVGSTSLYVLIMAFEGVRQAQNPYLSW
jgi:hypothetical protein